MTSSMKEFLSELRQQENDVMRRLQSVREDSHYVNLLHRQYPELPLVANKRCGLWYSADFDHWCYFKSTDGHTGHWKFNMRRLNLKVCSLAPCIIVDSTRKGKTYPDSFNGTVPLWCATINYVCGFTQGQLVFASPSVPLQVQARMQDLVPSFARQFQDACGSRISEMHLEKPLRPVYVANPKMPNQDWYSDDLPYTPVLLVSASRHQDAVGGGYIQGAGDDEEFWAQGLTPQLYWDHAEEIRTEEDVCRVVSKAPRAAHLWPIDATLTCALGAPADAQPQSRACVIDTSSSCRQETTQRRLSAPLHVSGKKNRRQVSSFLERVAPWLQAIQSQHVVVVGDSADNVMAVAIGVLVLRSSETPSKSSIRSAHNVCAEAMGAQLPRNVLKDLNRFFLSTV